MKKILFSIVYILVQFSAQANTEYLWINTSGKMNTGNCYEVDSKTLGKTFSNRVDTDLCRPKSTLILFNYEKGSCVEVDSKTRGKEYIVPIKLKRCKPDKVSFFKGVLNKRYDCYEVDIETNGKNYYRRVDEKNCFQETELFWKAENEFRGKCYTKPLNSSEYVKVKESKCRPKNIVHKFYRQGETRGSCYEQHPDGGNLYSSISKIEKCRPTETIYVFLQAKSGIGGTCFEIDSETKGNNYIAKVSADFCK